MSSKEIRNSLRSARKSLSSKQRHLESKQVKERLLDMPEVKRALQIASYRSSDEELDTAIINQSFEKSNRAYALPILHPFRSGHLLFQSHISTSPMQKNKFGLEEPKLNQTQIIELSSFDVVLVPLLGFDSNCQRIGMGGGYYDRSLVWLKDRCITIGLAFECQRLDKIQAQPWDQALDFVVTSSQVWRRL